MSSENFYVFIIFIFIKDYKFDKLGSIVDRT